MKIPSEVRIGGVDYSVGFVDALLSGSKALDAEINYSMATITIARTAVNHQHMCICLWHEILHGIANHANFDIGESTEQVIEVLSRGIYQVLQDNAKKLFDITSKLTITPEGITFYPDVDTNKPKDSATQKGFTPCDYCDPKVSPLCTEECQIACPETAVYNPITKGETSNL